MYSLAFLSIFAVYLSTLFPSIAPEDSGEFVTAAWTLGVPHASGYSLYVLLGKAASALVPLGNPAYRVNLFSAFLGAGTAALLARSLAPLFPEERGATHLVEQLERERWRKAVVALMAFLWALVPAVWHVSTLAEIYALQLFLGALCLWSAVRWLDKESFFTRRDFFSRWSLTSFLFGLGLSVHHTLVLWAPGLVGFLAVRRDPFRFFKPLSAARPGEERGRWDFRAHWRTYAGLAALFAGLAFSVQLFLFFRAQAGPLLNTGAPDILSRWARVILRQDYGTFSLAQTSERTSRALALWDHARHLWHAFTPLGLALAVFGGAHLARHSRPLFLSFLGLWLLPGPLFVLLANPPVQEHFRGVMERLTPLSLAGPLLFLGWGLYETGVRWKRLRPAAFLLVPLSLLAHSHVSGRGNLHARDFGVNLLKSLPPGAVLWDPGDSAAFSVMYQQDVAANRTDVAPVTYHRTLWGQERLRRRFPDLAAAPPEGGFDRDFSAHVLAGPRGAWVFAETPRGLPGSDPADGLPAPRYPEDALPLGVAYRYFPASTFRLVDPLSQLSLARLTYWWYRRSAPWRAAPPAPWRPSAGFWPKEGPDVFTTEVIRRYAEAHANMGQKFAQYGIVDLAEEEYDAALAVDPWQMEAYNNLGVLAYSDRDGSRAAAFFRKAAERDPDNAGLRSNLGQSYVLAEQPDLALQAFQEALRLDPNALRARFLMADILERQGKPEEALPHWRKLRDMVPDDKEVYWRLANAYARLDRAGPALDTLREYFLFDLTEPERLRAEEFQSVLQVKAGS